METKTTPHAPERKHAHPILAKIQDHILDLLHTVPDSEVLTLTQSLIGALEQLEYAMTDQYNDPLYGSSSLYSSQDRLELFHTFLSSRPETSKLNEQLKERLTPTLYTILLSRLFDQFCYKILTYLDGLPCINDKIPEKGLFVSDGCSESPVLSLSNDGYFHAQKSSLDAHTPAMESALMLKFRDVVFKEHEVPYLKDIFSRMPFLLMMSLGFASFPSQTLDTLSQTLKHIKVLELGYPARDGNQEIVHHLDRFEKVEYLKITIGMHRLSFEEIQDFLDAINRLPNLKHICIDDQNLLSNTPKVLNKLFSIFARSDIITLSTKIGPDISHNTLKQFLESFQHTKILNVPSLFDARLLGEYGEEIWQALSGVLSLKMRNPHPNLSDQRLSLLSPLPNLKHLSLELDQETNTFPLDKLRNFYGKMKQVSTLRLKVDSVSGAYFEAIVENFPNLEVLILSPFDLNHLLKISSLAKLSSYFPKLKRILVIDKLSTKSFESFEELSKILG